VDTLKLVHVGSALVSIAGFVLRGAWMWRGSPLLRARATRVLPHVVDSILLASAIALALRSAQYPFVQPWLTAKLLALLLYIVLGSLALKRAPTRAARAAAGLAALAVFLYIVAVAMTRRPMPLPGLLS
jgi:uncharacterized membrane protein SirB2